MSVINLSILLLVVLAALSKINECIDRGDPQALLACLELATAKLNNVRPKNAELYQIILSQARREKAEVSENWVGLYYFSNDRRFWEKNVAQLRNCHLSETHVPSMRKIILKLREKTLAFL